MLPSFSGKTLLSKEGAIRLAEKGKQGNQQQHPQQQQAKKVFYLSLVATNKSGFPTREHYLFDIASQLDFKGYDVTFMSAQDLVEMFCQNMSTEQIYEPVQHQDIEETCFENMSTGHIYGLVQQLVNKYPDSSYFLDEVPFIGDRFWLHPAERKSQIHFLTLYFCVCDYYL